ncbi:sodium:solute symporter [Niabella ginsenosidivorans]|uniref:Sodium:solute symporter n=1 Tax=Niabella ginsenosidivorans TaxID=1176587 RepID=A0A1A9I1Z9_9BACT|nr:sodium:solute symporter [Niabella ginsenosidivorans]ANH80722.1 sodium:solute symporter [Niabella ginsenosidivorans]
MKPLDWIVLIVTLACIILYGVYKSRTSRNLDGYFLSDRNLPWYLILLSIMGTQASAITFLAAPGQAYTDGMRFVQYYFGLPVAAIIICISFVPVFSKLRVFTAYEYLENRFDLKTRTFTSFLFLMQRGLSTGISIYAPSIILSVLLGWNIYLTNLFMGGLLIIYTVTGGAKAVAYTQTFQFLIIMGAMFTAAYFIVKDLPEGIGFSDALQVGGKLGKMNIITSGFTKNGRFDWGDRYNIFSGIIGGFFLALSYFGTDQSQVGRYLTAKSLKESRLGLLMNGLVKVPMQFLILLIGVLVFAFYQFNKAPAFFNDFEIKRLEQSVYKDSLQQLQHRMDVLQQQKEQALALYPHEQQHAFEQLNRLQRETASVRTAIKGLVKQNGGTDNDTNYIFLRFVVDYLPAGLVGLIIAIIFLASWGSIAAALNSLASCTMIDFHKQFISKENNEAKDYKTSQRYTLWWGLFCIAVAMFVTSWGSSLIEVVNILGSLFYGTILGIFLVAFYSKIIKGNAVFWSALVAELIVILLFFLSEYGVIQLGFLWLNAIGALLVWSIAYLLQWIQPARAQNV